MPLSFTQLFAPKQVNNAAADTLYTVPATPTNSTLRNGMLRFSNTTSGAVTIKAWAVQAAGSAADSNVFLPTTSLNANTYLDTPVPVMAAGGILQAQAGAATSITVTCLDGFVQT